jgi:hypothetical protein
LRQLRKAQQTASPCAIKVVERQCGLHVAGTGGGKRGGGFSQSFCVPSSMWRAAVWTGDTPSVEAVKCRL